MTQIKALGVFVKRIGTALEVTGVTHELGGLDRTHGSDLAALSWPLGSRMTLPFLYRCPNTGRMVQGLIAEEVETDSDTFESVECLACTRLHFVNPNTGRVLGEAEE